jgi:hypothetical protein
MSKIDIVFDGPPGPVSGKFVEVEDAHGHGLDRGEWVEREDGFWVLRMDDPEYLRELLRDVVRACGKNYNPAYHRTAGGQGLYLDGETVNRIREAVGKGEG